MQSFFTPQDQKKRQNGKQAEEPLYCLSHRFTKSLCPKRMNMWIKLKNCTNKNLSITLQVAESSAVDWLMFDPRQTVTLGWQESLPCCLSSKVDRKMLRLCTRKASCNSSQNCLHSLHKQFHNSLVTRQNWYESRCPQCEALHEANCLI